jgi:hypothetical protein
MPIDNVWLVTQAIRDMIKARTEPAMAATVNTTAEPPQAVTSGTNLVSVYLFHLMEDAHHKNQPPRGGSGPIPIQHVPLGLTLYYVVTTQSPGTSDPEQRGELEQKLLGLTAKAIHDQPVLAVGADDKFQLLLRPVGIDEAINFWSSDSSETANLTRPSLFLEARVVLLEREPPQTLSGRVLSVGSHVLVGAGPQLTSSRSTLTFVPPGLDVQQVQAEPARVALFRSGDTPFLTPPGDPELAARLNANNHLTLRGAQLGSGQRFLDLERGAQRVRLNLTEPPPPNAIWQPDITSGGISLRFWTSVFDELTGASVDLLPGIYSARLLIDEPPRPRSSQRTAFAVIPQVKGITPDGGNQYTLSVMGAYLRAANLELQLAAGSELLELNTGGPLQPGQYTLAASGESLSFRRTPVPGERIDTAHPLAVNLTIEGAQATPSWIEVAP